ncbi:probable WRKY transcription factor 51 [Tanacetum coccineum]
MDAFLPLSDEDQIGNPNFSSSSLNYPSNIIDDRVYDRINVDNTLYYNYNLDDNNSNPNTLSLVDHQDSSSANTLAYLNTNEQTPDLLEVTTDVNNSQSPQISADATSMTQLTWIERQLLYDSYLLAKCSDNSNREKMNDVTKVGFRIQTTLEVDLMKRRFFSGKNLENWHGCKVKKTVERDRDDSSYMLATYIGLHNHEVPSMTASSSSTCPTGVWTVHYS